MKHFFIVTNAVKDKGFVITEKICAYIRERGASCDFLRMDGGESGYAEALLKGLPEETECIIVVGGDGTLIRAARETFGRGIPLIGLNLGNLGYLCELEADTVFPAIDRLLADQYMVEERMMLTGRILRGERTICEAAALNDIVIHRSGSLHVVCYRVSVNGQFLSSYSADGIIAATPTGSTAYSMSAGGPIIDPKSSMLLLTPINPHNLNNKSIVLDDRSEIRIEMTTERADEATAMELSFDGALSQEILPGDCILIGRAELSTRIVKLSKRSFLEILQRKMQTYN